MSNSIEALNELSKITSFPFLEGCHSYYPDLGVVATQMVNRARDSIERVRTGRLRFEAAPRTILVLLAIPRTGKTHTRLPATRFFHSNLNYKITNHTWESAEKRAIDLGKIITPPSNPFTPEELDIASDYFIYLGFEKIKQSLVSVWEVPIMPAVMINDQKDSFIGRNLGFWALYNLTRKPETFIEKYQQIQEIENPNFHPSRDDLSLPPLDIYFAGLVGGKLVREMAWLYRAEMKMSVNRREGREIALRFGKIKQRERFLPKRWDKMRKDGASPMQLDRLDDEFHHLVEQLPDNLRVDVPGLDTDSLRQQQEAVLLRHIILENYGVPLENAFIGLNNPTLEDLGITDSFNLEKKSREIRERYYSASKIEKLD